MSTTKIPFQETRNQEPSRTQRLPMWHRAKGIALSLLIFVIPLSLFSIIQYTRYGFGLFLGWDTSTYAWSASVFSADPIRYFLQVDYPHLYIVILAGLGSLIGQISLAERILPFLVALPLGYSYYQLTYEVTSDRRLGYLAALLGGLSVNTLRLESDLNRNMLSFSASMILGLLVTRELSSSSFSLRKRWKRMLPVWFLLLAVAAYSQIETYLVVSLSLLVLVSVTRNFKATAFTSFLVALPVIVALPLIWTFLVGYPGGIKLAAFAPASPLSIIENSALFLGGFGLPCTVLGLLTISESARNRNLSATFILSWLVILVILLPIATVAGLPYDRFLYVVPIPMIMATGLKPLIRFATTSGPRIFHFKILGRFKLRILRKSLIPIGFGLLLIATLLTSVSTTDGFLRPYVSQNDVNRLNLAASIIQQRGFNQPILVMYGPLAADVNPIYRAYFGIDAPYSFAYYGKLQYLFSLPNPADVYSWRYDPSFEMTSSLRYRAEILSKLGNISLASHPIVIAGGDTYDRPLSEAFIAQFEIFPGSGIYIIPSNDLQPTQVDYWRLYAYSDWTTKTASYASNATWAQSQHTLNYLGKGPGANFDANFTISLSQSWSRMKFTLSFYDWRQPYYFPDTSNATLAPLDVLFDNQAILRHDYAGSQATTISLNMSNVSSGIHSISIKSVSNSTRTAVAVALDEIQLCPINSC